MLAAIDKQGVDVINGVKTKFDFKFGSLVDVMCFEPHRVKDIFYQGNAVKAITGNPKKICDIVLEGIEGKKGEVSKTVGVLGRRKQKKVTSNLGDYQNEIILAAKTLGIYKGYTDEKLMTTVSSAASKYFEDKVVSRGKNLIKPSMWALAHQTATTLMTHKFSAKYFNHKTKGIEIIYQYKFDTKVNGRRVKGMLDCLIINHNAKLIIPVDLKTGEAPVKDFPMLYTSYRYYVQGALYKEALKSIVLNDYDLAGYVVRPFEFLYISKLNPYKPMIFVVEDKMHDDALNGFEDKSGYEYKGVYELLGDYYSCVEDGFCDYTRDEEFNKGRISLTNITR